MKASTLIEHLLDLPGDFDVVIDGGEGVGELPVRWTGMGTDGRFGICVAVPEVPSPVHWCAGTRHGWPVLACGEDSRVGAGLHTHDRASVSCPACCVKLDATGWTPPTAAPEPLRPPSIIPRGESKTVRLVINGGLAVEYVHPGEYERVRREIAAAQRLNEANAHSLKTVRGWYDNAKRERADLAEHLEMYRAWLCGVFGIDRARVADCPDNGFLALVAQKLHERTEQRGRDLSEVERRERERLERERDDYRVWAKGHVGLNLLDDSDVCLRGVLSDRLRLSDGFRRGVVEGRRLGREESGLTEQARWCIKEAEARLANEAAEERRQIWQTCALWYLARFDGVGHPQAVRQRWW